MRKTIHGGILAAVLVLAAGASAFGGDNTLYNFSGGEGKQPWGGVIFDASGNLYGTLAQNGPNNGGSVYELQRSGNNWVPQLLYAFPGNGNDGPVGGLVIDAAGNLYGTSVNGGANNKGFIFELSPSANGWTETTIHSFNGTDGAIPWAALILDAAGNLYGTTGGGGASGNGSVFELSPGQNGWTLTTLYSFSGPDGSGPYAGVVFDSHGNLFGTTSHGGTNNGGTVFRLLNRNGSWFHQTLYNFTGGNDGEYPLAGVLLDGSGSLYGASAAGGYQGGNCGMYYGGCGAIFKLSSPTALPTTATQEWSIEVLHEFLGASDGGVPYGALSFGPSGSLLGTTYVFGEGYGTVFQLASGQNGWTLTNLYSFTGRNDGGNPAGPLIMDQAGNLYSTTVDNGSNSAGVVFEITANDLH